MFARRLLRSLIILLTCLSIFSCTEKQTTPPEFKIESGFSMKLVAAEPLIKDPVDFDFNESGDAMVLEMPGYPFEDQQSRIVILKDRNNDGVFEDKVVFAEGLQLASSILPFQKGVLVAAPPYLLHVRDLNQDNKADAVDTLMGGFATENLQHNYNGLTYGLDNWIYAVNGGNSGKPYWWGDTTSVLDLRGQDFRLNLDKKVIERLGESSGGFGLGMDEFGHLFETHNTNHIASLVFPDRYLNKRQLIKDNTLSTISDHEENGLSRVYPIGEQDTRVNHPEQSGYFSGACGITYYGGGALGKEYENTVWVADVVLNLIHVDKIKPSGASFSASRILEQKDFIASTDRAFRPVNMTVGPEGAMYVVDMSREVIEHPEWIPDDIEKGLNLEAGKDKGRIYKIIRTEAKNFDFTTFQTVEGMISNLEHPNQWVRKTSHRLLVDYPLTEVEVGKVSALLYSENEMARLHALWILHLKNILKVELLLKALQDTSPGIRENALLISENYLLTDESLLEKCITMSVDPDQLVRMQAALTLSTVSEDQFNLHKTELLNALVKEAALETDDWNVAAITLASQSASAELFSLLITASAKEKNVALLTSLAFVCNQTTSDLQNILAELSSSSLPIGQKRTILHSLIKTNTSNSSASIRSSIDRLEQSNDIAIISELAALRTQLHLPPSSAFLKLSRVSLQHLLDYSLPDSIRYQQLALIAFLPYKEKSDALFQCLQNTEPLNIQESAMRQLSTYQEVEIGKRLVKQWNELGPQARRWASDLLLYINIHHNALLTGLENGTINIGEMNFDLERRRTLLWWTDNEDTKRRAKALFSDSGFTNRQDAINQMKSSLTLTGSALNGDKVFQTICSNCHVYGSKGQRVGPVLTEISRKSKESLMHDILDPNAAVETKYINHRLETKTGLVHIGIVDSETDQNIVIKKMGGESVTVEKTDIKQFTSLGKSLMMEGLEGSMTPQEMSDLLAYLQNAN
jgi:putative membrane-bound dehydrogenase-like protein